MVRALLLGRLRWCLLLLVLVEILSQQAVAAENADRLWDYATCLYRQQDFYRALTEYQRFLFFFPTDPRAGEAELQIGRCYRKGGEPEKAHSYFIKLFGRKAEEPVGRQALLEAVAIFAEQNRYPEAIYWTRRFVERYPDAAKIDAIYLQLAWLQIDSGYYDQALATLGRIGPESDHYVEAISVARELEQRPDMAKKSPELAGALSAILPGAGQLYAGRPVQAVASLLLNGLFIGAAVVAFTHDSPVLGGILVFFELGWYQGGIRSAAAAARQANQREERQYRQDIRRRYRLSFGFRPWGDQPALALRLSF